MTNSDKKRIKEVSRLKILFTVEKLNILTLRVFSARGFYKVARYLNLDCFSNDENIQYVTDKYKKETIKIKYEGAKRKIKINKSRRR